MINHQIKNPFQIKFKEIHIDLNNPSLSLRHQIPKKL
jgi:hypothetical protein